MTRRLLAVVVLCGLSLVLVGSRAAVGQTAGGVPPAAQTLSRCIQASGRLSVLEMVDESGSLHDADPLNQRVDGLKAALSGLVRLTETPVDGHTPTAEVLLAGFSAGVHPDPNDAGTVALTESLVMSAHWQDEVAQAVPASENCRAQPACLSAARTAATLTPWGTPVIWSRGASARRDPIRIR